MNMSIGGLDIGSTGAKLTVMDEKGTVLHSGYQAYPVSRRQAAHELHPDDVWHAARSLLKEAAAAVPGFQAVGITSFGESFVLLDEADRVLMPAMLYTDPRGEAQAVQLEEMLGGDAVAAICGTLPHPMFSLPKLIWVREERPDLFTRAHRVCLMADYVAYMLTGNHIIDYSLAARTMALDINRLYWSETMLSTAGVDAGLFGQPVPSGTLAGTVRPHIAEDLGLPSSFQVVLCGHDQIAAAAGSGVLAAGKAANGAGTVECITPVFSGIPGGNLLQRASYAVIPFPGDNLYCCYAFSFAGGSLVRWFLDELALGPASAARAGGHSVYATLEDGAPDQPTGILVLPHFAGAGTPYMDTGAKGALLGLTLTHTTADLYRAVLEGIAYEDAVNLEALSAAGVRTDILCACGGGARSATWLQMKADILGIPVTRMAIEEAGTVGSVMFTGVASGLYASLEDAANALVKPLHTYEPRPAQHAAYQEHYARYRRAYNAVRPLMA